MVIFKQSYSVFKELKNKIFKLPFYFDKIIYCVTMSEK